MDTARKLARAMVSQRRFECLVARNGVLGSYPAVYVRCNRDGEKCPGKDVNRVGAANHFAKPYAHLNEPTHSQIDGGIVAKHVLNTRDFTRYG